jgi:hypothetical protein
METLQNTQVAVTPIGWVFDTARGKAKRFGASVREVLDAWDRCACGRGSLGTTVQVCRMRSLSAAAYLAESFTGACSAGRWAEL